MPLWLRTADPGFEAEFHTYVERRREEEADVRHTVSAILADVRARGDAALLDYTRRFDRLQVDRVEQLRVDEEALVRARRTCSPAEIDALELAAERIRAFHQRQLPQELRSRDGLGVEAGVRWSPIEAVGLYVPGGTAAYPSSVLMNAIPARVAGCRRLVMAVPTPGGEINPLVLVAAAIAGVDEIWRIGGAQAIAALAWGTESIRPVDKIVGPGNAYVAEAKRQVFGRVGIDMIAGPSELVVVADAGQDPGWIAADLLSQAEHDERAQTVLITDDEGFARRVAAEVERQLEELPRAEIARTSWQQQGAVLVVEDLLAEAPALVDRLAPEHLELVTADPDTLFAHIRHAGAVFLGPLSAEVIGDYVGGPNHVLPTSRTARFASGLGVHDFMKRTTFLRVPEEAFRQLAPAAATLARAEGLVAHARAVERRLGEAR